VQVDLLTGLAYVGGDGIERLFGIENLVGTNGVDQLAGNDGANVLNGWERADVLTGRGGADRFDYDYTAYSTPTTRDVITDFSQGQGDKIDLADIDAKLGAIGNEGFTFIGQAQFSGEGQLRYYQQNGDTFIEANTTGATTAEMTIVLDPLVAFQATDFLL
jgi:Ca2+-binding RTX toxin-like protein